MSETLEAIARALFKSWFVDFDPVRAKSEGRDPGLPLTSPDLFPTSCEDSELGEIPAGWRVHSLPAEVVEAHRTALANAEHDTAATVGARRHSRALLVLAEHALEGNRWN